MEIRLTDYLKSATQAELAKSLQVTAGAVNQWVKNERDIRIVQHNDGSLSAYQVKPVGKAS